MAELEPRSNANEDDFYGDQDVSTEAEVARRNREVEALRRRHFKVGLREGASDARDSTLQGGFDKGFAEGAKAAAEPGFIFGVCSVLDSFYSKTESGKKSSVNSADILPENDKRETSQHALGDIRSSRQRLKVWLQDAPVQSVMDISDIREACKGIVPFTVPSFGESVEEYPNRS